MSAVAKDVVASISQEEVTGDDKTPDIRLIPFNKLVASPESNSRTERAKALNVESLDGDSEYEQKGDVESMADTLEEEGQLFNLIVFQIGEGDSAAFGVADGETRRLATALRIKRKQITGDHKLICSVHSKEDALRLSWVANEKRREMGLADKFLAFKRLIDSGDSVEVVAKSNDLPVAELKRILRLADLHPTIFKHLRKEGMPLDIAIAFAGSGDHSRQISVFKVLGAGKTYLNAYEIRRLMQEFKISQRTGKAKFITAKAYEKAGGAIESDLFDSAGQAWLVDLELVDKLVSEKLDRLAKKYGKGWAWVQAVTPDELNEYHHLPRLQRTERNTPAVLSKELEELEVKLRAIDDKREAMEDEEGDDADEQWEALNVEARPLESRIREIKGTIRDKHTAFSKAARRFSGVVVSYCSNAGSTVVLQGVQTPENVKSQRSAVQKEGVDDFGLDENGDGASEKRPKGPGKFARDMGLRRRAVVRASLASPDMVAIARLLLECELCLSVFNRFQHYGDMISLNAPDVSDQTSLKDEAESLAYQELERFRALLDLAWLEAETLPERLVAFSKLGKKERDALVSFAVAMQLTAGNPTSNSNALPQEFVDILCPDPVGLWRPDRDSYFKHLKSAEIYELGMLWYGCDSDFAVMHKSTSKSARLDAVCRVFESDPSELTPSEIQVREQWVPAEMQG